MNRPFAGRSMVMELAAREPFRLGNATIDPVSREARWEGGQERLQPQTLKVLIALASKRGEVVTRDELVELCWDGRVIGDDVINRSISLLRQFAEHAGGFAIETVPRAGYRLREDINASRKSRLRQVAIAGAALALVLTGTILALLGTGTNRFVPTIVVLPFTTASSDSQEREIASNARDEVVHTLSQTEFRVGLVEKLPEGRRPAPDFVVSANATSNPDSIIVAVRVTDTLHDVIVYSKRYESDRAHAGSLPDQIGGQIAGSLGWTASLLMLEKNHPSDPAVTAELFGQGGNYQTARQIAAKAPNSALAQTMLAFNTLDAIPDLPRGQRAEAAAIARRAAERAGILAPGLGSNEILWCGLHSRARLIECEDHLRQGTHSSPNSVWVEFTLADLLKDVGRSDEALGLARVSLAHDQFVPAKIALTIRMLEALGRHDEAEMMYRQAQLWWPDDPMIASGLVYGTMARGDLQAVARFGTGRSDILASTLQTFVPVLAAVKAKNATETRKLCPIAQPGSPKRDLCMLAFIQLGDNDDALALASRIYPTRIGRTLAEEDSIWLDSPSSGGTDLLTGPVAAPLRRDPRYLALADRLGLLRYWRQQHLPDFCTRDREPICGAITKR